MVDLNPMTVVNDIQWNCLVAKNRIHTDIIDCKKMTTSLLYQKVDVTARFTDDETRSLDKRGSSGFRVGNSQLSGIRLQ